MVCSVSAVLVFLIIYGKTSTGITKAPFALPGNVIPEAYELYLHPNLDDGTYKGHVIISMTVMETTSVLTLHSRHLKIINATVNSFITTSVSFNVEYDFVIITHNLPINSTCSLQIHFEGDLKNKTYGFYRGYDIIDGNNQYFAATLFEPVNAREAFPCFDEPPLKAYFSVRIQKPSGYIALSNTKIKKEEAGIVWFERTPKMSTYLLAFFVGKYDYVESFYLVGEKNVTLRMYGPRDVVRDSYCEINEIPKQLEWFKNYTQIDFELEKLDFIAINKNFHPSGGMENWGLITELSDILFFNKNVTNMNNKLSLKHEITHMWFGDLVTIDSWGEIWLNEGFATFFDMRADKLYPGMYKNLDISSYLQPLLWYDDDIGKLPLTRALEEPLDQYEILNLINYFKGGYLLHMIENIIGEENFRKFIQEHLRKHMYGNVSYRDVAKLLENYIEGALVFLETWILQSGYPLVTVEEDDDGFVLQQERFLRRGQSEDTVRRWTIPIIYITSNVQNKTDIIWMDQITMKIGKNDTIDWIKLNHEQTGLYRVNYSKKQWAFFAENMEIFSIRNRMNLLDDAFAMVRSGLLNCGEGLQLTKYLSIEYSRFPWIVGCTIFETLRINMEKNNVSTTNLFTYIQQLVDRPYKFYGWEERLDESYEDKKNRIKILKTACYYEHPDCLNRAKQLLKSVDVLLKSEVRNILMTIFGPNMEIQRNNTELLDRIQLISPFIGAKMSNLHTEVVYDWPKIVTDECDMWFLNENQKNSSKWSVLTILFYFFVVVICVILISLMAFKPHYCLQTMQMLLHVCEE